MTDDLNTARRLVMTYIACTGFKLSTTNNRGERPVVVALASERLKALQERIVRSGGYATVFVVDGRNFTVLSVMEPGSAIHEIQDVVSSPVDGESTVGLLLDYLRKMNGPVTVHLFEDSESVEVEKQTTISV